MNNNRVAACYMRYSSHAQDEGYSIEAQERAIRKYAYDNNYDLKFIYMDKARTGTNDNRPDFQRLIKDSKKQLFSICLVHKIDRFARSVDVFSTYKTKLANEDIRLISITEDFEDNPEGEVMQNVTAAFSQYYISNLSREVKKGHNEKALQGLHNGGTPPLGYDVTDEGKYIINEAEAEVVRLIFDRYSSGYTYNDIAKELNLKGYTSKSGNEFAVSSMSSILKQRKYIGEYVYNKRVSKKKNGSCNSHKSKPEEEITRIPNAIPRIISDETFNLVQKRLEQNKRKTGTYKSNTNYLLSGVIKCGVCGFSYQGNTRKSGRKSDTYYSSYRCGQTQNHKKNCGNSEIEKNRLETFVLEQLEKHLFSDEAIRIIVDQVNAYNIKIAKEENSDLPVFEKQLKKIEKQIKNVTSAIAQGVDMRLMIDKMKTLDSSKKELEQRILETQKNAFPPIVEEDVRTAVSKFKEFMKANNYIECKHFINHYIKQIVVGKDKVEVTFMVASAFFNALYPNDESGAILIILEISREELKKLPKQRRKIPPNGDFGKSYLKEYKIINN